MNGVNARVVEFRDVIDIEPDPFRVSLVGLKMRDPRAGSHFLHVFRKRLLTIKGSDRESIDQSLDFIFRSDSLPCLATVGRHRRADADARRPNFRIELRGVLVNPQNTVHLEGFGRSQGIARIVPIFRPYSQTAHQYIAMFDWRRVGLLRSDQGAAGYEYGRHAYCEASSCIHNRLHVIFPPAFSILNAKPDTSGRGLDAGTSATDVFGSKEFLQYEVKIVAAI